MNKAGAFIILSVVSILGFLWLSGKTTRRTREAIWQDKISPSPYNGANCYLH